MCTIDIKFIKKGYYNDSFGLAYTFSRINLIKFGENITFDYILPNKEQH